MLLADGIETGRRLKTQDRNRQSFNFSIRQHRTTIWSLTALIQLNLSCNLIGMPVADSLCLAALGPVIHSRAAVVQLSVLFLDIAYVIPDGWMEGGREGGRDWWSWSYRAFRKARRLDWLQHRAMASLKVIENSSLALSLSSCIENAEVKVLLYCCHCMEMHRFYTYRNNDNSL
jgi:hypothetical protein